MNSEGEVTMIVMMIMILMMMMARGKQYMKLIIII